MKNRDQIIKWVSKYFDTVFLTEDFNGNEGGVWISGEGEETYSNLTIYDYYTESKMYELGVLSKWEEQLQKNGWYSEWYDAGTVMLWPI